MTDLPWYFQNLLRYSLQLCLLIGAAALAEKFLPLRLPRLSYAYWRVLLLVSLALPLLQPWPGPVRRFLPTGSDVAVIQDLSASTVTVASQGPAEWQIPYLPVLAGVLIVGMLFRLSRLLVGALSLRHALKRSRPAVLPWNMSQLAPGGGKQPRVVCVESVTSPATYGLFRPVILLPLGFSELTETQQLGVICHELRHVQRHDWLFRFAEEIVRCLFWFHPLVLWLTRRIELSREQSVDQEVVQILGQSRDYLDSLVEMAGARLSGPVAALFLSESYLRQRVRLIKEGFTMSTRRLSISLSLSFVFLLTAGAVAVWAFPLQGREQDQARPAGVPGGSAVESQKRGPESDAGGKQELIRVGGNVQRSKLIHWVPPEYPPDAEKAGIKGIVLLKVTVSETGDVTEVEDVRGHPMLVNAARAAVQQWKYSPTMLNGRAVPVIATQTVTFPPGNEPDKLSAGQSLPLGPGSAVPLHMDESGALFMGQERLDETNMRQVLQAKEAKEAQLIILPLSQPSVEDVEKTIKMLEDAGVRVFLAGPSYRYADGRLIALPGAIIPIRSLREAGMALGYAQYRCSVKDNGGMSMSTQGQVPEATAEARRAAAVESWKTTATYQLTLNAEGTVTDVKQLGGSVIPGVYEAISGMVGKTYGAYSSSSTVELEVSFK